MVQNANKKGNFIKKTIKGNIQPYKSFAWIENTIEKINAQSVFLSCLECILESLKYEILLKKNPDYVYSWTSI